MLLNVSYSPYIWPLMAAFLISGLLSINAWRNRHVKGAKSFGMLIAAICIWIFCYMMEIIAVEPEAKMTWLKLKQIGVVALPLIWLAFALVYAGREEWLRPTIFIPAILIALFNMGMAFTNELHYVFWANVFVEDGIQNVVRGPLSKFSLTYNYVLFLSGMVVLFLMWLRAERLYKRQMGLVLGGALVPLAGNMLTIFHLSPFPGFDLTPFAFTITGAAVGWSLFRFQFLDIVPVAHEAIVRNMTDAMIVLDLHNRIVSLNPAAQSSVIGLSAGQSIGASAAEVLADWGDMKAHLQDRMPFNTELTMGTEDDRRHFELHASPLHDRRGRYTGRLIVLHDITERVRAAEEREKLIVELDAFAHTVAHDLKNPLGVVMNYAEMLAYNQIPVTDEKRQTILEVMNRNTHKMNSIIDELLLLSSVRKLDEVERVPVDMPQVIGGVQDRLMKMIEDRQPEIVLPEAWPAAVGYSPWVEEVLTNYMSNAIKYGGDPPRVELGATQENDGMVRFWVRDNGPGIAVEHRRTIFNQFTRLDTTRAQGHGLGLSIVQRIVDKLGGEVAVDSEPGQGSTFSFTLPEKLS